MSEDKKCVDLVKPKYESRMKDLKQLWEAFTKNKNVGEYSPNSFSEYPLCVDYVEPGTFSDENRGFLRYQIEWGGPQTEFRFFFKNGKLYLIEFWYMDWFDGAHIDIENGEDFDFLNKIFQYYYNAEIITNNFKR